MSCVFSAARIARRGGICRARAAAIAVHSVGRGSAPAARGKIFSWTVIHRALHPGFNDDIPYAAVVVELDEGVRVVSHVIDLDITDLRVGLPVEVVFEDVTPDVTLHKFRPSTSTCA